MPEPDAAGTAPIRVRAAGVNFSDLLVRRGEYPQQPELPWIPGIEVAGEAADGRRVMGVPGGSGGGYAELCGVPDEWRFELPDGASFEEGAAFLLAFLTVWIPLTRQLAVRPGSTVLVHAAAGGVGSAAVQLARHLGARVVATASTEEKRRAALELGADEARAYDDLDGVRADVVVDPVGGAVFEASLRLLSPLGAVVALGYAGGPWPPLDPALLVGRNVSVTGFFLGRLMRLDPPSVRAAAEELVGLWRGGAIRPLVGATFPLERAAEAHALIEQRRHVGKVVLVP